MLGLRRSPVFALLLLAGCGRSILLLPGVGDDAGTDGTSVADETDTAASECGNGVVEADELCDGSDLGGWTCVELGFAGGDLSCSGACIIDASACMQDSDTGMMDTGPSTTTDPSTTGTMDTGTMDTGPADNCGNGVIDDIDEECDGADFGGINCVDLGFGPGLPLCTVDCLLDISTCPPPPSHDGEPCNWNTPCPEGYQCVFGSCYDGTPGDPCGGDNDCLSNDCMQTMWGQGTCN